MHSPLSTPCRHYRPILRTLSRNHATHGTNAPSNFRPSENGCNFFWSNTFETTHKQDKPRLSETSRNFSQIVQNQQHIFSIFPLLRGQRHHLNRSRCEGNWIIMGAGSHQDCSGSINLSDQRIKSSSRRRSVPSPYLSPQFIDSSNNNESPFSYDPLNPPDNYPPNHPPDNFPPNHPSDSYPPNHPPDNFPRNHWAQGFRETSVNSLTQHSRQDSEEDRNTRWFLVVDDSPSLHGPPTVLYFDHPDKSCLQSTQFMTLDQAFRFLHAACVMLRLKPQKLPSGAETVISRFKTEFTSRHGSEWYGFYDSRRDVDGVTPPKMAYHLWHVWCLTRYCGHEIRLLDKDKVVRLDTVEEDPISLGVIIFYHYYLGQETQCLQSLRKGFRYIDHTIGHDQEYGLHCDIDTCNCSNCL